MVPQLTIAVLFYGTDTPQKCHFRGDVDPPCNAWFLGTTRVFFPNGISIVLAVFAQLTLECHYTLQRATTPPKIAHSPGGLGPI